MISNDITAYNDIMDIPVAFELCANGNSSASPDATIDDPVELVLKISPVERFDVRPMRGGEWRRDGHDGMYVCMY